MTMLRSSILKNRPIIKSLHRNIFSKRNFNTNEFIHSTRKALKDKISISHMFNTKFEVNYSYKNKTNYKLFFIYNPSNKNGDALSYIPLLNNIKSHLQENLKKEELEELINEIDNFNFDFKVISRIENDSPVFDVQIILDDDKSFNSLLSEKQKVTKNILYYKMIFV